ncbi:MAG: beta-N-acetylhexosaminidase [Pseudohongiellaceae bacterium]
MSSREHRAQGGPLMIDLEAGLLQEPERELLCDPLIGGVILFSRNIESPGQVEALCGQLRAARPDLLIAVDQEGGRVQRLREGWSVLPPMAVHGRVYREDRQRALHQATEHGWLMATEVLAAGIDLSFAPVLDLDAGISKVIGDRALAGEPDAVIQLGRAFIAGMDEAGMAAVGKHFPGHGHVEADSHHELPDDSRDWTAIEQQDLEVFRQCVDQLQGIMPAHVRYSAVDGQPAGFSRYWLQEVLRGRLGFGGVIFSDDLSMAGAASAGGMTARVDVALQAGCDCLLVCNDPTGAVAARDHLAATRLDLSGLHALERLIRPGARELARDRIASPRWHRAVALMHELTGEAP